MVTMMVHQCCDGPSSGPSAIPKTQNFSFRLMVCRTVGRFVDGPPTQPSSLIQNVQLFAMAVTVQVAVRRDLDGPSVIPSTTYQL